MPTTSDTIEEVCPESIEAPLEEKREAMLETSTLHRLIISSTICTKTRRE